MISKRIAAAAVGATLAVTAAFVPAGHAITVEPPAHPDPNCRYVGEGEWVNKPGSFTFDIPEGQEIVRVDLPEGWTHKVNADGSKVTVYYPAGTEPGSYTLKAHLKGGNCGDGCDITREVVVEDDPELVFDEECDGSSFGGSAAFGLSAIAGGALLAHHFLNQPAPQGPATGPVWGEDKK